MTSYFISNRYISSDAGSRIGVGGNIGNAASSARTTGLACGLDCSPCRSSRQVTCLGKQHGGQVAPGPLPVSRCHSPELLDLAEGTLREVAPGAGVPARLPRRPRRPGGSHGNPACPGDSRTAGDRPAPSGAARIFVVGPPLRGSPSRRQPEPCLCTCTAGESVIRSPGRAGEPSKIRDDPRPDPLPAPAVAAGRMRAVTPGQVTPGRAGPRNEEDPVHDPTAVPADRPPTSRRQHRARQPPFLIRHIVSITGQLHLHQTIRSSSPWHGSCNSGTDSSDPEDGFTHWRHRNPGSFWITGAWPVPNSRRCSSASQLHSLAGASSCRMTGDPLPNCLLKTPMAESRPKVQFVIGCHHSKKSTTTAHWRIERRQHGGHPPRLQRAVNAPGKSGYLFRLSGLAPSARWRPCRSRGACRGHQCCRFGRNARHPWESFGVRKRCQAMKALQGVRRLRSRAGNGEATPATGLLRGSLLGQDRVRVRAAPRSSLHSSGQQR